MCPSYRFVVKLIKPIFDRPKSVSLMCPMDVMRRLQERKWKVTTPTCCLLYIYAVMLSDWIEVWWQRPKVCVFVCRTCQVWGLCGRCRSCEDTPTRGRSLQSTFEPYRRAKLRCSSAAWRSLHLQTRAATSDDNTTATADNKLMITLNILPSTYSITMQRCLLVSKEQNMETTNGFSANVRMSLSTKACWIWFLRIRFCLLIFFMAKRCRVSLWRTRNTALQQTRYFPSVRYCSGYFNEYHKWWIC